MTPDPLPSWNDSAAKRVIYAFVDAVTSEGGPDYVPPAERIATFDNDGTLWSEYPLQTQVFFAKARLAELAAADPTMAERQPFKAFLEHDVATIHSLGKQAVFEIALSTHAGMTVDAFQKLASHWLAEARHPWFPRRFVDCVYQPQAELLAYLRASGFKIFIVTGGGIDFVRTISEANYAVPPEQVVGSSVKLRFEIEDRHIGVFKTAELGSFNDREAKPANIALHIGQRPILAFGNSDGDLAMLRYVRSGSGPRLALLLHHDDGDREFAYDREFRLSPLAEALDRAEELRIVKVSMKQDWGRIFVPEPVEEK